jgi:hypothetical protein
MSSSSPQDESDLTLAQQVAITLVPAFSGTLSILGSSCIIWMLLQNNRKKLNSVKYRFLFALCWCDVVNSLCFVFFSLPIPKDTPGVWGAMGNYASCNAQGFFLQIGITGSFYNGALSLYFYKSVCSSMKDEQIAKRYEKWIHIVSLLWPVGTGIAAWQQDLYSYSGLGCWIAPEPLRCHRRDDVDCIRGENAYIYAWVYCGIPLILLCLYIVYSMGMIYMQVKQVSRRAEKWSLGMVGASIRSNTSRLEATQWSDRNINDVSTRSQTSELASKRGSISQRGSISGNDNRVRSRYSERTKEAAWQAFLYVIAYAVTHIWAFIVFNIELGGGTNPFYLLFIENFFWPLQGFANVFIFLRPRIQAIQKSSPEMFFFTAAYHSVFHYDEVRRKSSKPMSTRARPDEGSLSKNAMNYGSGSFQKSTGEESDAFSLPRQQKEDSSQQVIHEEDLTQHDADERKHDADEQPAKHDANEQPTIALSLFAQITVPDVSRHQKADNFQQVIHEVAPAHHGADEEMTIVFSQRTGPNESRHQKEAAFQQAIHEEAPAQPASTKPKRASVKSVLFADKLDNVK